MPSKRRPQARPAERPRATTRKSISHFIIPRTWSSRNFDKLTPRQQDTYRRTIRVVGTVRRGDSLSKAAQELGASPATVLRYFPDDFSKSGGSRQWVASKSDRHVRFMKHISDDGMSVVRVHGSREASQQSLYLNDVRKALIHNDPTLLARWHGWHGKRIGNRRLITSFRKLTALADSGALQFEDLYSDFGGGE
jgi:hypothetical protein